MKREEKEKAFKRITMSSVAVREEDNYRWPKEGKRKRKHSRATNTISGVEAEKTIEVAEILSLVPQLEEKYR